MRPTLLGSGVPRFAAGTSGIARASTSTASPSSGDGLRRRDGRCRAAADVDASKRAIDSFSVGGGKFCSGSSTLGGLWDPPLHAAMTPNDQRGERSPRRAAGPRWEIKADATLRRIRCYLHVSCSPRRWVAASLVVRAMSQAMMPSTGRKKTMHHHTAREWPRLAMSSAANERHSPCENAQYEDREHTERKNSQALPSTALRPSFSSVASVRRPAGKHPELRDASGASPYTA